MCILAGIILIHSCKPFSRRFCQLHLEDASCITLLSDEVRISLCLWLHSYTISRCTRSHSWEQRLHTEKMSTQRTHLFVCSDSCTPCLSVRAFTRIHAGNERETRGWCIRRDKRKSSTWAMISPWHTIFVQPCHFMAAITYAILSRAHTHAHSSHGVFRIFIHGFIISLSCPCVCVRAATLNSRTNSGTACKPVTC